MRTSDFGNMISVTELRTNISQVLEMLDKENEPICIISRSKPRAILINVKAWQEREIEDPFKDLREKYGDILKGLDVVSEIRKARDKRWNLS